MVDSIGGALALGAWVGAISLYRHMRDNRAHNKAEAKRRKDQEIEEARRASMTEEERQEEDRIKAEEEAEERLYMEEWYKNYQEKLAAEEAEAAPSYEELEAEHEAKKSTEDEDDEYESKFGDGPVSIYDLDSVDDLDELTDEQYDDVEEQLEEWAEEQEELVAAIIVLGSMR